MSAQRTDNPWLIRLFFLLIAIPFFGVFPFISNTNNPNENSRTFMTMALVENHTFELDAIVERQGWTNDMARVPEVGNPAVAHWHCVKGPATSYLGVPVYWAFTKLAPRFGTRIPDMTTPPAERVDWLRKSTWALRLGSVQLPCFLFLVWLERYLRRFSADTILRLTAVAAAGIGTNFLGYAQMFVSHSVFGIAAFWCFGLAECERATRRDPRQRRPQIALLAGLCAGWVTMLEYHGLPLSVVLTIFGLSVFRRPKNAVAYLSGGAVTVALQMFYQWRSFHNPLSPGHQMVENPVWAAEHKRGIFGMIWPSVESVVGLSIPIGSGFFGMSPYMWIGLLAIPVALATMHSTRAQRERRTAILFACICMAALWFAASGAIEWRAGWTLGPRRLGAAPPFFALLALTVLEQLAGGRNSWRRAILQGAGSGLALVSVIACGVTALVYNTLPESMLRPFLYFAWPMLRTGFTSHHVLEWFGVNAIWPWYAAAASLVCAPVVVALAKSKMRTGLWVLRIVTFAACFAATSYVTSRTPKPEEVGAHSADTRGWHDGWEPEGRNQLTIRRKAAQLGGEQNPCLWLDLAAVERILGLTDEAASHAALAGPNTKGCAQ